MGADRSGWVVPFARRGSVVDEHDLAALVELVRSGEPLSSGRWRERFEDRFRELVGARYAMSVTSGTVALQIAIQLLDLEPGDEVIVTPQTFQASIQPLLGYDVTVRFCDVDPATSNMDPGVLRSLIGPRTRAIVLVHYGGYPAEMTEIVGLARRRGIVVVEDAAHALGASYHGRRPGALGDIGCFSFHTSKNITTLGEGGMITFERDEWVERVERIRSNEVDGRFVPRPPTRPARSALPWMKFAVSGSDCLGVTAPGTNATMSEAAAAVGLVQLDKVDGLIARRRAVADAVDAVIAEFPGTRLHRPPPGIEHAHHLHTFYVDGGPERRHRLIQALDRRGVEVQLRYFPLHLLPEWRWRGHRLGECPVAERIWFAEHMNLPCHPELSEGQVGYLCAALGEALAESSTARPTVPSRPQEVTPCP